MNSIFIIKDIRARFERISEMLFSATSRSFSLAFLRVYVGVHLTIKCLWLWPYMGIVYGPDSLVANNDDSLYSIIPMSILRDHYLILITLYLVLCAFMVCGIGKRITILSLFVLTDILHRINMTIMDGGDSMVKFILLYLSFADSFSYLSLEPLKKKTVSSERLNNCLTNLAACSLIMQLMLAYFNSGLEKERTSMWSSGVGLYYAMVNDRFDASPFNLLLVQNPYFVTFGSYFVMMWELTFCFLIWIKGLRWWVLGAGAMFHLGIFYFLNIGSFSLLFISMYVMFIKNEEWARIHEWIFRKVELYGYAKWSHGLRELVLPHQPAGSSLPSGTLAFEAESK